MKKIVLILLLAFLQFGYSASPSIKINHPENVKIISIRYEKHDAYEKEIPCVVTIQVNGHTYVGHGTGTTVREACDNAYEAASNFAQ